MSLQKLFPASVVQPLWAALSLAAFWPATGLAQDLGCHLSDAASGPARQILVCDSGPRVEAEASADVHVLDQSGHGKPDAARISAGAALVDVPEHYPGGFQILTPQAIASVRGTIWAVDVQPQATSVFVVRGRVSVRRPDGARAVTLAKGQGVDVGPAAGPLKVTRWPPARAAALLARFGR